MFLKPLTHQLNSHTITQRLHVHELKLLNKVNQVRELGSSENLELRDNATCHMVIKLRGLATKLAFLSYFESTTIHQMFIERLSNL